MKGIKNPRKDGVGRGGGRKNVWRDGLLTICMPFSMSSFERCVNYNTT